jgi:hypothetical protein
MRRVAMRRVLVAMRSRALPYTAVYSRGERHICLQLDDEEDQNLVDMQSGNEA